MDIKYSTYSYQRRMSGHRRRMHPIWTIVLLVVVFKVITSAFFWKFIFGIGLLFFGLKMISSYNKVAKEEATYSNRNQRQAPRYQKEQADFVSYKEEPEDLFFDLEEQPRFDDDLNEIISEKHKMFK